MKTVQDLFEIPSVVAFAGSRHGTDLNVASVVAAVLAAGAHVRVGCQRGVDEMVRGCVPAERLTVVSVKESRFARLLHRGISGIRFSISGVYRWGVGLRVCTL